MYTIIASFVIGFCVSLLTGCGPAIVIVVSVISTKIGVVLSALVTYFLPKVRSTSKPVTLLAIHTAAGPAFVTRSGRMYHYMRAEDCSMVPGSVWASELVHIAQWDELVNTGTLTITSMVVDKSSWLYRWALIPQSADSVTRYDFRVPSGTVVHQ